MYKESYLQQGCVTWFQLSYPKLSRLLFATPNAAARSRTAARRQKAEGMVAGVADLILLTPSKSHHALLIEMKQGKGKQSEYQKEWQTAVEAQGYKYVVCYSLDEFREVIINHIENK